MWEKHMTIDYLKIYKFVLISVFNYFCFLCVYSLFVLMRDAEEYQRLVARHNVPPPSYTSTGTTYVKI